MSRETKVREFLSNQNVKCENENILCNYVENILNNCELSVNEDLVLENNKFDIRLTSLFIDSFENMIDIENVLGYTSDDKIVVNFNNGGQVFFEFKDDNIVRVYTSDSCRKLGENFIIQLDKVLENNVDLVKLWIKELNNKNI